MRKPRREKGDVIMGRTYVMSDIHGMAELLERMLRKIAFSPEDTLYILGDMIDRGPEELSRVYLYRRACPCFYPPGIPERACGDLAPAGRKTAGHRLRRGISGTRREACVSLPGNRGRVLCVGGRRAAAVILAEETGMWYAFYQMAGIE